MNALLEVEELDLSPNMKELLVDFVSVSESGHRATDCSPIAKQHPRRCA